jgi:predicted alpha/beta hydrolase family esterase
MQKLYVIHGYGSGPNQNWFPWLKSEVERMGVEVNVLTMPDTNSPICLEWVGHLESVATNPNEDTYFVGHSLGCITILRYLNNLSENAKVGGVVLVAGFASPIHFTELNSFFEKPLDREKIKKITKKIIAINSDNDPHVPYWQAEELANNFDAELVIVPGGKHLNKSAGFGEFLLLLNKLKEAMSL